MSRSSCACIRQGCVGTTCTQFASVSPDELLANASSQGIANLWMTRDWGRLPSGRIYVEIVLCTLSLQMAALSGQSAYKLAPLHKDIAISSRSAGTKALSLASCVINW